MAVGHQRSSLPPRRYKEGSGSLDLKIVSCQTPRRGVVVGLRSIMMCCITLCTTSFLL